MVDNINMMDNMVENTKWVGKMVDDTKASTFALTCLIFVIFFTRAKFLENEIYTEKKRVNYDKIHRKLPIFALLQQNTQ